MSDEPVGAGRLYSYVDITELRVCYGGARLMHRGLLVCRICLAVDLFEFIRLIVWWVQCFYLNCIDL